MSVTLPVIIAELQASLAAVYPAMVFFTGERYLEVHGVPPQIVFVPRMSPFSAPDKRSNNPRALWTKDARLEVNIWGDDYGAADTIEEATIQAVHRAAWCNYTIEGSEPSQPDYLTFGHLIKLTFSFRTPRVDVTSPTVVPTSFAIATGSPGGGVLELGG